MSDVLSKMLMVLFTIIVGTLVAAVMKARSDRIAAMKEMAEKIQAMQAQMGVLNTQISPLWARVQSQIASELHHPHPRYAEMDELLEKLEKLTITESERVRLKVLLVERSTDAHPDITEAQRSSAVIMAKVMDKVLTETANVSDITNVGLVGVKEPPGSGEGGKK